MNLEKLLDPKSVAVVGASSKEGSVGRIILEELTDRKSVV